MAGQNPISLLELRRLLHELRDFGLDIGIRFRLIGEMWQPLHHQVLHLTEHGVALRDPASNKLLIIPDLSQVMQFEIDQPYQQYQPHFHYAVDPVMVQS